ncbi:MAG: hypothetical protein LBT94_02800 [Prevotellaceae bacterium]|jgi:hypothetical protein|nr:hypothetical protein [Prevotellaceae bacterium]
MNKDAILKGSTRGKMGSKSKIYGPYENEAYPESYLELFGDVVRQVTNKLMGVTL